MSEEETMTTEEVLIKQLEDPLLSEQAVALIERKLEVLRKHSS